MTSTQSDRVSSRASAAADRFPAANRLVKPRLRFRDYRILKPGVLKDLDRPFRIAVRDRDDPHAGRAMDDLVHQPLGHETGADDADADRPSLGLTLLKSGVDENHLLPLCSMKRWRARQRGAPTAHASILWAHYRWPALRRNVISKPTGCDRTGWRASAFRPLAPSGAERSEGRRWRLPASCSGERVIRRQICWWNWPSVRRVQLR